MSTLKTNNVQVGQSVTATNNFTIYQPATPDGTVRIGVGNSGATTTDVITVNSSGNVGMGTSSPASRLHTRQDQDGVTRAIVQNRNGSGTPLSEVAFITGSFDFSDSRYAYIQSGGGGAQYLAFGTGNGAAPTERARIDSSGRFLVATTTVNNGSLSNFNFQGFSNGIETTWSGTTSIYHVLVRNGNGFLGGINTSGSTTTYTNLSDYRVKENVQPMQNALSKVNLLKPCTFTYKVDGKDGQGFIAHELQEVFADAVVGEKDAVDADGNPVYQGIDTSFLVATLTAAIQEQQQMIETLQAKVTALEAKG